MRGVIFFFSCVKLNSVPLAQILVLRRLGERRSYWDLTHNESMNINNSPARTVSSGSAPIYSEAQMKQGRELGNLT